MGWLKGFRNKGHAEQPAEQSKWENLTVSSVGGDVEQLELLLTAGGDANPSLALGICSDPTTERFPSQMHSLHNRISVIAAL